MDYFFQHLESIEENALLLKDLNFRKRNYRLVVLTLLAFDARFVKLSMQLLLLDL